MSKVKKMLSELCPKGVEFKRLADVARIRNGKDYKQFGEGKIPVYGTGGIMKYIDTAAYDKPSVLIPRKGSLDKLYHVDVPFWTVDTIFYTEINDFLMVPKFFYYYLKTQRLEEMNQAGGVPSLTQTTLNEIPIPVPHLKIQKEVVRILDNFMELEEELEAELEARQEQYQHYRNTLLTFDDGTAWMTLGELCEVYTGGEAPDGGARNYLPDKSNRYPIYGNGTEIYGYTSDYKIDKDAVTISSIGANTGAIYFRKAYFTPIVRLKVLIPKSSDLSPRYLFHYLSSIQIYSKKSSVPNLNANDVKKIKVPVLSFEKQEYIAAILDKFDVLVNDTSVGLPAEIKARRQQYEYYRDQLLNFKEIR